MLHALTLQQNQGLSRVDVDLGGPWDPLKSEKVSSGHPKNYEREEQQKTCKVSKRYKNGTLAKPCVYKQKSRCFKNLKVEQTETVKKCCVENIENGAPGLLLGAQKEAKRKQKGATWSQKGAKKEPKWSQRATKMHPKIDLRKGSRKCS